MKYKTVKDEWRSYGVFSKLIQLQKEFDLYKILRKK
jgi:hypothetical protein